MRTVRLIVHPMSSPGAERELACLPARYRLARGRTVPAEVRAPAPDRHSAPDRHGAVDRHRAADRHGAADGHGAVEATVSYDAGSSKMAVFAVNRDGWAAIRLQVVVRDVHIVRVLKHEILDGVDVQSAPPRVAHGAVLDGDGLNVILGPASWTLLHLAVREHVPDEARHRAVARYAS